MINKKNIFRLLLASLLLFDTSLAEEQGDEIPEEITKPSLYIGASYNMQVNSFGLLQMSAPANGELQERIEEKLAEYQRKTGRKAGDAQKFLTRKELDPNAPKLVFHGIAVDLIYDIKKNIKLQLQGTYSFRNNSKIFDNGSAFINAYYGMNFENKVSYYIGLGGGLAKLSTLKEIGVKVYLGTLIGGFRDYLMPYVNIEGGLIVDLNRDLNAFPHDKRNWLALIKWEELIIGVRIGIIKPLSF